MESDRNREITRGFGKRYRAWVTGILRKGGGEDRGRQLCKKRSTSSLGGSEKKAGRWAGQMICSRGKDGKKRK